MLDKLLRSDLKVGDMFVLKGTQTLRVVINAFQEVSFWGGTDTSFGLSLPYGGVILVAPAIPRRPC